MDELAAGLRVVRGPDWNWGKQDGGERHVGTVTRYESPKEVVVMWDSGTMANYRCSNPYDLRVLDSACAGVRHDAVVCNGCSATPIFGTRWQCVNCAGIDLCSTCYHGDKHDLRHQFYRIPVLGGPKIKIGQPRSKGRKDMCKGIVPGAKVVRGAHWQWEDQDGGDGKKGKVIQIQDWDHNHPGSGVLVEWENGYRNLYRLTFKGKVDVKVVKEAKGKVYYFEHLPLLGETKVPRRGSVAVGDYVRVGTPLDVVRRSQAGHGGWCEAMMECMMNVGRVSAINQNGDAVVVYQNRSKWTLNPAVLSKVFVEQPTAEEEGSPHGLSAGDFVKIVGDVRKVKALQKGHGEWVDSMTQTLGRVGQIVSVFPDGDIKLKLPGHERLWTFNPESVTKVEPDGAPLTPSTTEHVSEMLRSVFESHIPANAAEALVVAAANGNVAALSDLLHSRRGDCGVNDKHTGQTALHAACKNGHLDAVKCLLAEGAQLEVEDSKGDFPIHHAALGGEPEVVELLAQEGADLNVRNQRQQTPLHVATVKGHLSVMRALLTNHCHASLQDSIGDTPLHDAITKKREDIVRLLAEHNANPGLPNKNGFTAIHLVALKGNSGALRIILSKLPVTCSLDDAKDDGFTALHLAALNNHRAVAELLLESGASRDPRNLHKATPLHLAVERQNVELVRLLVDSGTSVNVQDKDGRTPLHEAIQCHVMSQLKTLTGSGSDMSAVGLSNSMEKKSSASIASFLVSRGADPLIKNKSGHTALDLCSDPNLARTLLKSHQENQQISPVGASGSPQHSPVLSSAPSPVNECAVCSDTRSDTVFLPCGHIVMCWSCAERVKRCIVCKDTVETKQKVEECMVCSDKLAEIIFQPCGHIVTCQECSKKIRKCLSCREAVEFKQLAVRALPSRIASAGSLDEGQTQNLLKEVEALKEQLLCSICCDRKKNCVLNCGHTYCQMCADQMKTCPLCSKTIQKRLIMFDS